MDGTFNVLMMQIFLLCLMLVGAITVKVRIMDEHSRTSMSDLVINVFLPCNILSSFFNTDSSQLSSFGIMLVISLGVIVLSFVLSQYVLYRKVSPEQKKVLMYATIVSNASGRLGGKRQRFKCY